MEETPNGEHPENIPANPQGNKETLSINISKRKLYLSVAIAIIFILTGVLFYIYSNNYLKKIQVQENQQTEDQIQEDVANDKGEENEAFDLFSDKYMASYSSDSDVSSLDSGNSSSDNQKKKSQKDNESEDDYSKWKTYLNSDIGYMLKYPSNWKLEELSDYHEVLEGTVKNIAIYTPDNKYFLLWGIKENDDPFFISGRTGIGVGDLVSDEKITILDTDLEMKKYVYEKKIVEYPVQTITGGFKTKDGRHACVASFLPNSVQYIGKSSAPNIPEVEIAKKILRTIEIVPRSGKICQSELSEQEKSILDGWGAFYNNKYKYLVRISNGWTKANAPTDEIIDPNKIITYINEKDAYERFQIRSEEHALVEIPKTWTKFSAKKIKVACSETNVEYFSRSDMVFLVAYLSHNGKRHSIYYGFKSPGASITSSIIETYEALIKSIVFDE